MNRPIFLLLFIGVFTACSAAAQTTSTPWKTPSPEQVNAVYPEVESLYFDLHRHPELALQEQQIAAKLADRAKALG
jgi:hippurate hydrolase